MHAEITDDSIHLSAAFVFLLARYLGQPWPFPWFRVSYTCLVGEPPATRGCGALEMLSTFWCDAEAEFYFIYF